MTTEYDKARNPDSKSKELGPGLASWDRLDALENAVTNLSIRQNKKMAELETYIRELNPGLCEPIPTAPAQNPLFDSKPSQAWKDTGENLEPVIQLSDVMDKLDRHSTTLELINDSIVLLTNVINRNAAAKPTIKEAEWRKNDRKNFS